MAHSEHLKKNPFLSTILLFTLVSRAEYSCDLIPLFAAARGGEAEGGLWLGGETRSRHQMLRLVGLSTLHKSKQQRKSRHDRRMKQPEHHHHHLSLAHVAHSGGDGGEKQSEIY